MGALGRRRRPPRPSAKGKAGVDPLARLDALHGRRVARILLVCDPENGPRSWWRAARKRTDAPSCLAAAIEQGAFDEVELTRAEADRVLAWAQTLPGWSGALGRPTPLLFFAVGRGEVSED